MTDDREAARQRAQVLIARIDTMLAQPRADRETLSEWEAAYEQAQVDAEAKREKPKPLPARAMARTDAGYIHRAHGLDVGRRK